MTSVASPTTAPQATSRPLLSLGVTFLLIGIGFASPLRLAPHAPEHLWPGAFSNETLNLYALTVFAGWSHFFYAWRGQWAGTQRMTVKSRTGYWLSVIAVLVVLDLVRGLTGVAVFSLLAWVWNIAHFVKAERFFAGERAAGSAAWLPVIAFAWFTVCLFPVGLLRNTHFVFAGSVLLGAVALATAAGRMLARGEAQYPILTLFLLGETLVWSKYGPYMSEAFCVGVYIFHIAGASFFHYLSGYFYGESRNVAGRDVLLRPLGIVGVNGAILALGGAIAWVPWLGWLRPVFGVEAFTLFVALHLAASDLLPWWKRRPI